MYCKKCGAKTENETNICVDCEKIGNNEFNIKISRPSAMGFAVKLHVTVDDIEFDLASNDEKVFNLTEGVHTVKYKVWCRREHQVDVSIEKGKLCHVIFKYDALWGGFKISKKSVL